MTDYNFKDGRIYEGSRNPGSGKNIGNVKDDRIYEGFGSPGAGKNIGNVKGGCVYSGVGFPGAGHKIGTVDDFTINGIQREKDETIVAVYHFLIKKIF